MAQYGSSDARTHVGRIWAQEAHGCALDVDGRLQIYRRGGRHWQCAAHIKNRLATSSINVMREQGARLAARGLAQPSAVERPDLDDDP